MPDDEGNDNVEEAPAPAEEPEPAEADPSADEAPAPVAFNNGLTKYHVLGQRPRDTRPKNKRR